MKSSRQSPNKLGTYLTVTLGVGCLAGQAEAATVVTFYGPGAKSSSTNPATPAGINVGTFFYPGSRYIVDTVQAGARFSSAAGAYFTTGSNLSFSGGDTYSYGRYLQAGSATNGATLNSNKNYASLTFNLAGNVYDSVGQFYLDGAGGGYLVALARNSDHSPLSISAGKAAIDAVPEPSALALLALGAGGLIARRRRPTAA